MACHSTLCKEKLSQIAEDRVPYNGDICPTSAATLANCRLSGCNLLRSACVHNCQPLYTTVGTHAPAAYSDVADNTTAIPSTIGAHAPAVLPGLPDCLS